MFDVVVIGAGMAGLVCAQQLVQAGYSVVVIEKSRGLGGRVATRRLHDTSADHGTSDLKPQGELLGHFVQLLRDRQILQVWTDTVHRLHPTNQLKADNSSLHYVAPAGITAIAKFLATGLEIWRSHRVQALSLKISDRHWHLTLEAAAKSIELTAKAVVVAIPAPQALTLLEPLADTVLPAVWLENLRSVTFDPCLSVIAGYPARSHPAPNWQAVTLIDDPYVKWIGLDSSKRQTAPSSLVFVLHSSAEFAQQHLTTSDLNPAGFQMLVQAAKRLVPWLHTPAWLQVHRWRYAFPRCTLSARYLSPDTSLPLVCSGDWCGGSQVEGAMLSGLAAAEKINLQLQQRILSKNFLDRLVEQAD